VRGKAWGTVALLRTVAGSRRRINSKKGSARRRTSHETRIDLYGFAFCRNHASGPAGRAQEAACQGKIFTADGLISHDPHYPVWRAGANAATTLTTDGDLNIGNLHVPAGTYTLFVDISDPANWVLIVSNATGEWGLAYDPAKDLGKTPMTMSKPPAMVEDLTYTLTDGGGGKGTLTLAWEDVSASVPVMVQ
jgi:hypothetical protein